MRVPKLYYTEGEVNNAFVENLISLIQLPAFEVGDLLETQYNKYSRPKWNTKWDQKWDRQNSYSGRGSWSKHY